MNKKAFVLAQALDKATERLLLENKSPARRLGQIDNRGSHFYLALFWANELANQDSDQSLKASFDKIHADLFANANKISEELIAAQGDPIDTAGYYSVDDQLTEKAMRPSETLNKILADIA